MNFFKSFLFLIARLCLAAIFLLAGIGKLTSYNDTYQYMAAKGFSMVPLFLLGAATLELLGGVFLIIGYRTRLVAGVLMLFLIPATLIFHDFWLAEGPEKVIEQIMFFKNLAIFGGLIYVMCIGAGSWACDARIHKREKYDAELRALEKARLETKP